MNDPRYVPAAYYWPAYHDEPRWRPFFRGTEGEWEIIRKARPKFEGHYQPRVPRWGFESEADPAVMEKKIDTAARHGVRAFIFDWYWYQNQPFLEDALNEGFLKAGNVGDIQFFLMWANHNATTLWDLERSHQNDVIWPGSVDRPGFEAATARMVERYMTHPAYFRIDGKPVLSIYEIGTLIQGLGGLDPARKALDSLRARIQKAGFPDLHLQAILWGQIPASLSAVPGDRTQTQANTVRQLGIDSLTNYQWCHYVRPKGDYREWGNKAVSQWETWAKEFPVPFYPHVSVGWDTNPRFKGLQDAVIANATPEAFESFLIQARDHVDRQALSPRLVTLNAWNEWSESSYLEPDERYGCGHLEAVKRVFGA